MLTLFVFISIVNLLLGFGVAAIACNEPQELRAMIGALRLPIVSRWLSPQPVAHESHHEHVPSSTPATHVAPPAPVESAGVVELQLPATWRKWLDERHITAHSLFEVVLLCIHIKMADYQERLVTSERAFRGFSKQSIDIVQAKGLLEALTDALKVWKAWTGEASKWIAERHAKLGTNEDTSREIEEFLLACMQGAEKLSQVVSEAVATLDRERLTKLLDELQRDLEASHQLADRTLELLCETFSSTQRLDELPEPWRIDPLTQMPNRLGWECEVQEWMKNDPHRTRLISCVLVECDRFSQLNKRFGIASGNDLLATFAGTVRDLVRVERGDKVARLGGASLVLLLSDTGAAGARCAAERIRQTLEAATFKFEDESFNLLANCSVTEYLLDDSWSDTLRRLQGGLKEAKKAGRNRTAIDEGDGPRVFDALPMTIASRVVEVKPVTK